MREKIKLLKDKTECCACGACQNICPKDAITFQKDENSFMFPVIDNQKCISCKACLSVCDFKKAQDNSLNNLKCYFGMNKDEKQLLSSSSGGVFSLLAKHILENNGVVFGCYMYKSKQLFKVKHIMINKADDLYKLQGSKYVQSDTEYTFREVKELLKKNCLVLYSGTPCQIAALKSFLKNDYNHLYTVDLICHGTPSQAMFNDFIQNLEKKLKTEIIQFDFRKKHKNTDTTMFIPTLITSKGQKNIFCKLYSYYGYFLNSEIYRESCYECKYANPHRVGDITIGDGWGFEDYLQENNIQFDKTKGISTILVNSKKGQELLKKIEGELFLFPATLNDVSRKNHQLLHPSKKPMNYNKLFDLYREHGYKSIDQLYFKNLKIKEYMFYKYLTYKSQLLRFKNDK